MLVTGSQSTTMLGSEEKRWIHAVSLLELNDVKRTYRQPDGQTVTVVDIGHFTMESNNQLAIAGQSGSGKTTFLNLIAGIVKPTTGVIQFQNQAITLLSESARDQWRARHIGYVFQTFNLLQGYSALENVEMAMRFGGGVKRDTAKELLNRVGLADRMNHKPRQMSVGQQQRVAVARAVANRPQLVLADEPTGNLDAASADIVLNLIRDICHELGAALLLVSHDSDVLAKFDQVTPFDDLNRACGHSPHATTQGETS